jgi:predicted phage gp36 major capsid-like protein
MATAPSAEQLLTEITNTAAAIRQHSEQNNSRFTDMRGELDKLANSVNELYLRTSRPGRGTDDFTAFGADSSRKAAIALLEMKQQLLVPKHDPLHPFRPTEDQIKEAEIACRAVSSLMHATDVAHLPDAERKALSSFSLGGSGFILRPEQSDRILSCLIDETDVAGLMQNINISGSSIEFMVDNVEWQAAWA